jgi:hypothetical protein
MSYQSQNPRVASQQYRPQSSDPASPIEGQVFRSDGTSRGVGLWEYKSGAWTQVGSSSSTVDTFVSLTGDDVLSTWASGNNATFLGGGSLAATFAKETGSPLNGSASYKLTQAAGSLNDYIASAVQAVPLRFRGNVASCVFSFVYDGAATDIEPIVWDVTNSTKLTSSSNLLPAVSSPTQSYKVNVQIPLSCTQLRFGFQVKVANTGKILQFDDVQIGADATRYFNAQTTEAIIHSANSDTLLDRTAEVRFDTTNITATNLGILQVVDDSGNTRTKFIALQKAKIVVSWSAEVTGAGNSLQIYKNGVRISVGSGVQVSTGYAGAAWCGTLEVNDYLTVGSNNVVTSDTAPAFLSILATAQQAAIITASESFSSDSAGLVFKATAITSTDPIGTFNTYTYAANNTPTIAGSAPTQTIASMNANGIQVFGKGYTSSSTAASPARVDVYIGANMKGHQIDAYVSTAKTTSTCYDHSIVDTTRSDGTKVYYSEKTGILTIEAATNQLATNSTRYVDDQGSASAYFVINASKNSALVGVSDFSVNARSYASATSISGSLATVVWTTSDYDSHNGMSSGVYTVPVSGKYQVNSGCLVNATFVAGNSNIIEVQKNSSVVSRSTVNAGGVQTSVKLLVSDVISCVKGDTIRIQVSSAATTPTIASSNFDNFISIAKVGS